MLLMLYSLYNINQGGYLLVDIVYPPEGNHPGMQLPADTSRVGQRINESFLL